MTRQKKRIVIYILIGVVAVAAIGGVMAARNSSSVNTPSELLSLGEKYLSELDYEQALVQFLKVVEIEPMNERAYLGAAEAYIGLGRIDDAIAILERGLAAIPDSEAIAALLESLRTPELEPEPESLEPAEEPDDDYTIEWADPVFERHIRELIEKTDGEIYRSDLDDIGSIQIWGTHIIGSEDELTSALYYSDDDVGIYSVNGVESSERGGVTRLDDAVHFKNLTTLVVVYNNITDASPLAKITNLTYLQLEANYVSNLYPLQNLTKLELLDVGNNGATDISALAGLTSLTYLSLYDNNISDISPLAGMTRLERLNLNNTAISNLSPLAGLTNLTYLGMAMNNISDISPLAGMSKMESIYFQRNRISDISPLANMPNLQRVSAKTLFPDDNPITDWSPLAHVENVQGRP